MTLPPFASPGLLRREPLHAMQTVAGSEQPPSRRWRVWREDDHGRRFEISRGHSEEEARRIVAEYERRGHKQSYGAEPEPQPAGGGAPERRAEPR